MQVFGAVQVCNTIGWLILDSDVRVFKLDIYTDPHVADFLAKGFAALPVGRRDVTSIAGAFVRTRTKSVIAAAVAIGLAGKLAVFGQSVAFLAGAGIRSCAAL